MTLGETRAHNHQFERVVMNGVAGKKLGFPHVEIEQTVCTSAKASASGLPRALGDACDALNIPGKDDAGRISMLQVTKPKKATKKDPSTRYTPQNAPDKFVDLYAYNIDDTIGEYGLDEVVPELTPFELGIYHLDQRINERGILVDLEAIANVKALIGEYKTFLELAMEKATRSDDGLGTVLPGLKPTQRDKIADWIRANGYPALLDMQAETVKRIEKDPAVPDRVKHVLRIYSTYNAKAVAKFDAILEAVCADGRLRGQFLYHGANTGRWSSLGVQLQNLFRPVIDDPETAVEAFRARDLEWIRALYPKTDPMKVFGSTVRSHLIAGPGKKFICLDYAGVESRMNAWLWNEEWKLQAFRDYDTVLGYKPDGEPIRKGPDLYKVAYARGFQIDVKDVTKSQRQIGKVMELALGYEGGVGAFVTMVDTYGINLAELTEQVYPVLPEDVLESAAWMWNKFGGRTELRERTFMACDGLKQLWRRQHPNIVYGWKELKTAAELAVQYPGQVYGVAFNKAFFKVVKGPAGHEWLALLLPSKRRMLKYYKPEWTPPQIIPVKQPNPFTGAIEVVEKEIPGELHYMGIDTKTRRYMRTTSYGGKWDENLDQGSCAELLRDGMVSMEEEDYAIALTVHDENGAEVEEAFGSVIEASKLMCGNSPWAKGLPLVAEGWEGKRYRK